MNINSINATSYSRPIKKTNDVFANEKDKHVTEKFNLVQQNDFGKKVFDLSNLTGSLNNKLLSNEVKMYNDDSTGNTIFRTIFQKPNSNEPMTVNIIVPNCKFEQGIDEKTFNETIGKAILLMDKSISMYDKLGDNIADGYYGEFKFKQQTGELDCASYVDAVRNHLKFRANSDLYKNSPLSSGKSVSEATILEVMKELEDFLFKLNIKN